VRQCILQENPYDFASWAKAAQRQQRNWFLIQTLEPKGARNSRNLRNWPQSNRNWGGWNNRQGNNNRLGNTNPAQPKAPSFDPDAMDVDTVRKAVTKTEKEKHCAKGRCYKCFLQGHIARDCPKKKKNKPKLGKAFISVVDDWLVAETEETDFGSISSFVARVKAMTNDEKDEFIYIMNEGDEDFPEAWVKWPLLEPVEQCLSMYLEINQ
jgi:hypothetical protein